MKLPPRDANAYFAKPDPTKTGLLIYGGDAMRVASRSEATRRFLTMLSIP